MSLACAPKFSSLITGSLLAAVMGVSVFFAGDVAASTTGFRQAVAELAWEDEAVASFYRETGYAPLWTADTPEAKARRQALMQALDEASMHGLPDMSIRASDLLTQMRNVRSTRDLGAIEVALSRALVDYATDLQTGLLNTPSSIDDGIVRKKHKVDGTGFLSGISSERPYAFLQNLVPSLSPISCADA